MYSLCLDLDEVAEALGYGSVKYFDLNHSVTTNYKFSFDKMLDPRGNTAVYMFYSYARICQIFKKAESKTADGTETNNVETSDNRPVIVEDSVEVNGTSSVPNEVDLSKLVIEHPTEVALAKCLLKFPSILDQIHKDLAINR